MNQIANINATMSSREIAELTGKRHDNVMADIRKMLGDLNIATPEFSGVAKVAGSNGSLREIEIFNLPQRETLILVSGYSTAMRARIIDRWQELEAVAKPAISSPSATKLIGELAVLECYTRLLRPSPSSQVAMLAHISKNHGLDRSYLPAYVEDTAPDVAGLGSMPTMPLTVLLKLHGISFTPKTYNGLLSDAGFLEERARKTTSPKAANGMKRFWVISEKGQRFGKNITNPNSPRETQPHWYESRFADLHALVTASLIGGASVSVKLMTAVFDRYPEGGGEMLVALKLADHADDDGSHIYPSIKYIAAKTRQSPRAVQYQLRRMQQSGFLILVAHAGGGRGKAREYRISREWINGAELAPIDKRSKDAEIASYSKGASSAQKGATPALKGANDDAKGRNSFAPESSGTVIEPSLNHQGARRAPRVALHAELLNLELPETIPFEVWDMWCEHREAKAKEGDAPWTRPAAKVSIKRLLLLLADGQSPEATIEEAVLRGWTGLFPVRAQSASGVASAALPDNWWKTESGITQRAAQLGITRKPNQLLEQFKAKVVKAAGPGEWMEDMLRTVSRESEARYEALYAYFNDIPKEPPLAEAA